MWHITWYSSIHAEHPFDHLSSFIILLGWSFYNSKSFTPNGSASSFGRRIIHHYPIQSSKFSRWLPEAPALVVPLIIPLIETPLLPTRWMISLPRTRAQLEVLIQGLPPPLYLVTLPRAPSRFSLWFPLRLRLLLLPMNCSKNSWRPTWSRTESLDSLQRSVSDLSRLMYRRCIMINYIWTAINSVSSTKTILKLLGPLGLTGLPLQLPSSARILVCAGRSTSVATELRS